MPVAGAAYLGADTMRGYLKDTDQLVSERSCGKLERGELRRDLERIRERLKDFEDPPPKGFAGLQ
jgi:peptide subunit release factor 1 (eRF1)